MSDLGDPVQCMILGDLACENNIRRKRVVTGLFYSTFLFKWLTVVSEYRLFSSIPLPSTLTVAFVSVHVVVNE